MKFMAKDNNLLNKLKYSPFYVQLVVTRKCNLDCGYCNEHDKTSLPVPLEILQHRIDLIHQLGAVAIAFTGGEPLLHPDIIQITAYAKSKVKIVGMITNAYLLTKNNIEELNNAGMNDVQISIDGVAPNEITVKTLQPLKKKFELLKKYAKFRIDLNSVIGSTNPNEALEVIKFAQEMGFQSSIGLIHDGNGQIKLNSEQLRIYKEANKLRKKPYWDVSGFEEKIIENGSYDFKCRAGSRYLYVDEYGNVKYCSQQPNLYSKPLEEYSIEDLKTNFYTKKPCSSKCTVGCVRRASWLDGWRNQ